MAAVQHNTAQPPARVRSAGRNALAVCAFLVAAHFGVQAQTLPTISCTSPSWMLNTGVNASGAKQSENSAELRWQYAVDPIENTDTYTAPPSWSTPVVKRLNDPVWKWTDFSDAGWITPNTSCSATRYTYYRFQFNMDPAQDPSGFSLGADFHADDTIVAIFVNGTKVGMPVGRGFAQVPPGSGVYYTQPGQFDLNQGWRAGTNEVVLQVLNAGGSTLTTARRYGGVAMQGRSTCGGAGVSKAFSAAEVRPGGTSTLTIEVSNLTNPGTDIQQLFVEDVLPAPLVLAAAPTTTCTNATLTGSAGDNTLTLSGASSTAPMLPAAGCSITAEVVWPATAQCNMAATNTIRPGTAANGGQFSTALGVDPTPASASLRCTDPSTAVAAVPTLSHWALALLSLAVGALLWTQRQMWGRGR